MDLESSKNEKGNISKSAISFWKKKKLFVGVILGILGFIIILILILRFTVFKPKPAVTTVNSIKIKGLKVSLDVPKLRVDLNVTLMLDVSVKNPNKAGFKYGNSSTLLYYRGDVVGEAEIPAGEISAGETIGMNTTLTVLANRLVSKSSEVYSDVISGTLNVSTYQKISGRVYVLKIFKHHMVSYTSCDISIDILNQTVRNSKCNYKTKM